MLSVESIRLKFRNKIFIPLLCNKQRTKIDDEDFTIISNNCWGGTVYESYNLRKNSPTVGMFFMAEDYIRFLVNLREYLCGKLTFINPQKSKWRQEVEVDSRFGKYPVGLLEISRGHYESIEIFFLHYHSEQEAKEKWERRVQRINWDRLLVKFNDQNGCKEEHIENFIKLPYTNKLFITGRIWEESQNYAKELRGGFIYVKQWPKGDFIRASFEPIGRNKYLDLNCLINNL